MSVFTLFYFNRTRDVTGLLDRPPLGTVSI